MQRWIVMSSERAFVFAPLRRLILTWHFSWHHEEMKEDALEKGLLVPDEAAVRDRLEDSHFWPEGSQKWRMPEPSPGAGTEQGRFTVGQAAAVLAPIACESSPGPGLSRGGLPWGELPLFLAPVLASYSPGPGWSRGDLPWGELPPPANHPPWPGRSC
jgi:hypothetical protein